MHYYYFFDFKDILYLPYLNKKYFPFAGEKLAVLIGMNKVRPNKKIYWFPGTAAVGQQLLQWLFCSLNEVKIEVKIWKLSYYILH